MLDPLEWRWPAVLFIGSATDPLIAKTAMGVARWRPDDCVGQIRTSALAVDVGLDDVTVRQAIERGAGSLLLGCATFGGGLDPAWTPVLVEAAGAGLDLVSGAHVPLDGVPGLADAAAAGGGRLIDTRLPPPGIPMASGRPRSGRRVLAVGTDSSVGKMFTSLLLAQGLRDAGAEAHFRATGQTGIMIAGAGIAADAVVCDFVAGAAEMLTPPIAPDAWHVVEGQGALGHPAYSTVAIGLLHGTCPDALVLCHRPSRRHLFGWPDFPLPGLAETIVANESVARSVNPDARCVGVSCNTSDLDAAEADAALEAARRQTGLVAVDPIRTGVGPLVEALRSM